MLELKNITKNYITGAETVEALKGINLIFRKNEFVSILGPSGCGKTTMLNIIGGLDKYTSGDLVISSKSTKEYKDRDWDRYRNHSVGFVFQNYNLIPHQSVLQNVELALTLSGVNKKERRLRAKEALEMVGLGDQFKKKPQEMSGGQMQRVAIARAIVNNPDIVLADEPTGALDTETSVQVMQILKEISKDRLVIMVTHNPDLALTYSTRIIKMVDGLIISDSSPLTNEELKIENELDKKEVESKPKKVKNPSMKFHTSFGLSLKNLISKKGRTILTSFAGSIGIIGIALIYAVSQGTTNYINQVQEETLASYPITVEEESVSLTSLLESFMGKAESIDEHDLESIYQKAMLYDLLNSISNVETKKNDLESFKTFIENELKDENSKLYSSLNSVQYGYNVDLMIYTKNVDDNIIKSDSGQLVLDIYKNYLGIDMSSALNYSSSSMMRSMMSASYSLFKELIPGKNRELISNVTESQYDVIYGRWPQSFDEVVLFVDDKNELDDMTLYALGLTGEEEIKKLAEAALNKTEIEYEIKKWSYEEICSRTYRTILSSDCYNYDSKTETYTDLRDTEAGIKYLYDNGLDLKVVGIARPAKGSVRGNSGYIGYTYLLTEYIINKAKESDAVIAQMADPTMDIFTNLPFKTADNYSDQEKADIFKDKVSEMTVQEKQITYMRIVTTPKDEDVKAYVDTEIEKVTKEEITEAIVSLMKSQMGLDEDTIRSYIANMSDEELYNYYRTILEQRYKTQFAREVAMRLAKMSQDEILAEFDDLLATSSDADVALMYDLVIEYSDSTYEKNLSKLGVADIESPSMISMYAVSFNDKSVIEDEITRYNATVDDEEKEIEYTDYIGIIMSSITTIINAITYVLIAFVAVSLIVSSIMIGVITLISVQERTKEIGILRSIGASKRNVSSMFNAETIIIGLNSGLIGVGVTYLLCIPINLILHYYTSIQSLNATLPPLVGLILIAISLLLTLISGIIPSRSAAKKDPVVALRTE